MHRLKRVMRVLAPLDKVFEYFNRPENLDELTPPFLRFSILTPPPMIMHNGAVFDYKIHLMGLPMRWSSIIAEYEPPHHFVDVQLRGPYSFWHHRHGFSQKEGCVEVTDDVHYEIGFSLIGQLVHALVIKRRLNTIFGYREKVVKELFR